MTHFEKIAAKLPEYGLDAMLVTSEPGEFYAVGFHGEGVAVVTPHKTWYYTDSRYIEAASARIAGAEVAMPAAGESYPSLAERIVQTCGIKKLGFEEQYLSVRQYELWKEALSAELIPASALLGTLRAGKDEAEIDQMIKAQRIAEKALDEALGYIKPGMTENEIAARLVFDMMRFGAQRTSFDPIVASGPNGSMPHAIPSERKVQKGDFITMDFGCVYGGYCSDMTRTVAVGEPSDEMKKVYHIVLEAQLAGIAAGRAGIPGREIDAVARKVIDDAGYGPYFGHSFGHSLGIEIHEAPNASPREETIMPVGAVVSAEPGIYLPGKFGVRIEDVVVLQEGGHMVITKAPKELIVL